MSLLVLAAVLAAIPPVQPPQPNRQPQLASAPGLTALVFATANSIWFAGSRDEGRTFSVPTQVGQLPVLAVGRHRGPRVAIAGKVVVISAIVGEQVAPDARTGLPKKGDLVAWRSRDDGRSWSEPVVINDTPGSAREGLLAMAAGPDGEVAAAWLDLRSPAGTRLYGSFSEDGGATWSKNVLLYAAPGGTICQCCAPSLTFSAKHRLEVMFRNVLNGARDMYLQTWNLYAAPGNPVKLGTHSSFIGACPMDGGGIAHHRGKTVTAWRRERMVYLDKPGKAEVLLGEGKDVTIAIGADGPCVAWTNPAGIQLRRLGDKQPACLSTSGAFPTLSALPDGSVLAGWEQDGNIMLKRIFAR